MAGLFVVTLAAFVLDADDLGAFDSANHVGGNSGAAEKRLAHLGLPFAGDQEDAVESDGLFALGDLAVDLNGVTGGDLELGSAVFKNGVHRGSVGLGKSEGVLCGLVLACQGAGFLGFDKSRPIRGGCKSMSGVYDAGLPTRRA